MKWKLFTTAMAAALLMIILALSSTRVETVSATWGHTWTLWSSSGVTSSEIGFWDDTPGGSKTGDRCGLLWLKATNTWLNPNEDEWARWGTTQINVNPSAGWNRLWIRYNRALDVILKVGVRYEIGGDDVVMTSSPYNYTWREGSFALHTTMGKVIGIWVEINDYPNSIGGNDIYSVLISYIAIRNSTGTTAWIENF
jgi:hypothetical protein